MLKAVVVLLGFLALSSALSPCGLEPSKSCVKNALAALTPGLRVVGAVGQDVYADSEITYDIDFIGGSFAANFTYSGLYVAKITSFYTTLFNTVLEVQFAKLPFYAEYTASFEGTDGTTSTFSTTGNFIGENTVLKITFGGLLGLSLDNAEYELTFESIDVDLVGFEEAAANDTTIAAALETLQGDFQQYYEVAGAVLAERVGRAYFLAQIANDEPERRGSIVFSTVQNRDCEAGDFACTQAAFAGVTGLTPITESGSNNAYIDTEVLDTPLGYLNSSSLEFNTYYNLDKAELLDFFDDGNITVLTVVFNELVFFSNYTFLRYTTGNAPIEAPGTGTYYNAKITVTGLFEGVGNISFNNLTAFSYIEGDFTIDSADLEAAAVTYPAIAESLAAVQANPIPLIREQGAAMGSRLLKAYVYTYMASEDGTSLGETLTTPTITQAPVVVPEESLIEEIGTFISTAQTAIGALFG